MQAPHRKPLPGSYVTGAAGPSQYKPQDLQHQQRPFPPSQPAEQNYTRSASAASGIPPNATGSMNQYPGQSTRRTLSNATSSTSSTSTNAGLQRAPTNPSFNAAAAPRRSTSSRSTTSASPTSYVALMRKQKATVWCDRAQHEDPRILAAQRAAKTRAAMEVAGGHNHAPSRVSTSSQGMVGGVRSKIRHHGAPKASTYTGGANLVGSVGVPMRLSASEVDEGDSDDDVGNSYAQKYHTRTGSGRSSIGSGQRGHSYMRGYSNGSTPPTGHSPVDSMGDLAEEETPVPTQYGQQSDDYFAQPGGQGGSGGSGGSAEERQFGGVGGLPKTTAMQAAEQKRKTSEDLKRRGSVDERTMTMSAGRLFVANPDLSD
ncbi:hypothetical protein EJ03DRAFT_382502 [Teratosphaeria nubilosa]|uniref:Pal1-domain-containing protein n=1 Tax=Teratosphaeria nubilosa TaxID=161662 RepID=A0A6G1LAA3_9PEZI|nr:hypothetical protein EJ03DRAFT_382502 [Teratosphaeria nubilosa]